MQTIERFEALPKELMAKQNEANEYFKVGDMFFTGGSYDHIIRISKIKKEKAYVGFEWQVYYENAENWGATKWRNYGNDTFERFLNKITSGDYVKLDRPLSIIMEEANKVISGEIDISVYSNNEFDNSLNEETALIGKNTKQGLLAIQESLEEKKKSAALIHKAVAFEMEKRKSELEIIRNRLNGVVAKFEKQIKKIMRVITTIELYLGIDEEIHQIQSGEKAPSNTPISFRQMVLFIDEEVGIHEDGGLDFKKIEMFDEWLVADNHIDIVLPEKKGMVVLRPRRKDKYYNENGWVNSIMNIPNHTNTYILIRNGDNIYRIFTEKLTIQDRLFPRRKELAELYDQMQKTHWDRDKEKIEDGMYQYKKRAILMQGLIDRTEIFHPLPVDKLNIFKLHEAEEYVNFIYDDEAALTDGKLPFKKWKEKINSSIVSGSRILLTGIYSDYGYSKRSDFSDRFYLAKNSYDGLKNVPDLPKDGVYEVELFNSSYATHYRFDEYNKRIKEYTEKGIKFKDEGIVKGKIYRSDNSKVYSIRVFEKENNFTIMYMPDAEATSGWNSWETHDRKRKTRFKIFPDDNFVLNYDQIDLEDINFYLQSRIDRENYLSMMPVLKKLKKHLLEELKNEEYFTEFVIGRNQNLENVKTKVIDAISWWKFKNKWKRAINKNDTLALRMIEKRIKQ